MASSSFVRNRLDPVVYFYRCKDKPFPCGNVAVFVDSVNSVLFLGVAFGVWSGSYSRTGKVGELCSVNQALLADHSIQSEVFISHG